MVYGEELDKDKESTGDIEVTKCRQIMEWRGFGVMWGSVFSNKVVNFEKDQKQSNNIWEHTISIKADN